MLVMFVACKVCRQSQGISLFMPESVWPSYWFFLPGILQNGLSLPLLPALSPCSPLRQKIIPSHHCNDFASPTAGA